MTEALEKAIGRYVAPEGQEEAIEVSLRIRELELEADAPRLRTLAEGSMPPGGAG